MHAKRIGYQYVAATADQTEAESAIARLESTLNVGDNRFGTYGTNCRDSIARWKIAADHARSRMALGEK